MKYLVLLTSIIAALQLHAVDGFPDEERVAVEKQRDTLRQQPNQKQSSILKKGESVRLNVVGEGVAPQNMSSPAQAKAMAKRAAMVEGYRLMAERIKGVHVEGRDRLRNMMINSSRVYLTVSALIKNAEVMETTFEDGLCKVEMEAVLSYRDFQ